MRIEGGLVELCRRHGLTSLLAMESSDPLVTAVHARQQARQTVMMGDSRRILERLADAGVRTAVVKGPAVAHQYANPRARPYSDLDYLVEETALDTALDVLGSDELVVEIPPRGPKASKRDVVVAGPTGVRFNLDLHWDLFSYSQFRGRGIGAVSEGWERARFVEDELGPRWVIPQALEMAFLTAHAVLDHRFRIILFRDLLELSARGDVDWPGVLDVANRWGFRSTTYLAFWIARGVLGAPVPEGFLEECRPRSLALTYLERAIPRLDLVRFDGHKAHPVNLASVLLADRPRDRIALAVRAPMAFPKWKRRVTEEHDEPGETLPRVLIVVSTNQRRGAEVFTERLRDGLTGKGWVVDAVALRGSRSRSQADVDFLVDEAELSGKRFEWSVFKALRRRLRTFHPDIIVANGGATLRYSLMARLGLGGEVAYMSIGEPSYWIRSPLSRFVNRLMLRSAGRILAVSEATRQQLIALEPSTANKTLVTYTGLTNEPFEVARATREGPLRVVVVGSLTTEKDPALALDAVMSLDETCLRFVGDGPVRADLEAVVADNDWSSRVEFVGSVTNVTPHLEWGDVLLITSRTEGLPGAILEASAAGLAIVAVDVGGVREAVHDGVTGLITTRDVGDLQAALDKLVQDRQLALELGRAGRLHMRAHFLIDDVVERYRRALEDLGR